MHCRHLADLRFVLSSKALCSVCVRLPQVNHCKTSLESEVSWVWGEFINSMRPTQMFSDRVLENWKATFSIQRFSTTWSWISMTLIVKTGGHVCIIKTASFHFNKKVLKIAKHWLIHTASSMSWGRRYAGEHVLYVQGHFRSTSRQNYCSSLSELIYCVILMFVMKLLVLNMQHSPSKKWQIVQITLGWVLVFVTLIIHVNSCRTFWF